MPQNIKEIDKRIRSIRNTQQITKAMKMVAAAKLRRAEDRLRNSRPYAAKLGELLARLAGAGSAGDAGGAGGVAHPFFEAREVHKRMLVVITSDKGLCGSYNANVIKLAQRYLDEQERTNRAGGASGGGASAAGQGQAVAVEHEIYAIGRKANEYFRRRRWPIRKAVTDFGGVVQTDRIHQIADELMRIYRQGEVQEIVAFSTRFISTLSYRAERSTLLPLSAGQEPAAGGHLTAAARALGTQDGARGQGTGSAPGMAGARGPAGAHRIADAQGPLAGVVDAPARATDYIYEPDAQQVLQTLLPKAVRNRLYMAVVESFTSEHGARMTSMSSATDNAGELIDKLVLFRNRARQAAITQEISEIVGGAESLV